VDLAKMLTVGRLDAGALASSLEPGGKIAGAHVELRQFAAAGQRDGWDLS